MRRSDLPRRVVVARLSCWVVGGAAVLLAPLLITTSYGIVLLNQALIFAMVVLGLNFIYGFGGILSLAQAGFWGIGAYTSAILTVDYGLPFVLAFFAAVAVAAIFGLLVGIPTLRLRTHYLTMATLGFGVVVHMVLLNFTALTHGAEGIRAIPPASMGPWVIQDPVGFYYLNIVVLILLVGATLAFRSSRLGRALEATRDDSLAASASGVNVTYIRVLAFALSAAVAGMGGSLWAHFFAYIAPETFDLMATIRFVAMLLIGGSGTVTGSILGALLLTYLPEWLRALKDYYMAIYGLAIAAILILAPGGLVGLFSRFWDSARVRQIRVRLRLESPVGRTSPISREEARA